MTERNGYDPQGGESELLPGWSSLVIMLTIFGILSAITVVTILRGQDTAVADEAGGTQAFGPADFPEIQWDEPLLPAVVEAGEADETGGFNVAPAPYAEGDYFPCSMCHEDMEVNYERRELEEFHDDIHLDHGPKERWCFDCHNAEDRDYLRLTSGALVPFDESFRLCGQCHGTIFRDWREGIHGRRRGFWNGPKSYLLCAHCHNPHAPKFQALEPLPPPIRPQFLAAGEDPEP